MSAHEAVVDFLTRELHFEQPKDTSPEEVPLLSSAGGVVDSVGLQQLIGFLENDLDLEVGDLDIIPENFETLGNLYDYLDRKLAEKAS